MPPEDIKMLEMSPEVIAQIAAATREVDRLTRAHVNLKEGSQGYAELETKLKKAKAAVDVFYRSYGRVGVQIIQNKTSMSDFRKEVSMLGGELGLNIKPLSSFSDKMMGLAGMAALAGSSLGRNLINPLKGTKDIISALPRPLQAINEVLRGQREVLNIANTAYAGFGLSMAAGKKAGRDLVGEIGHLSQAFGFSRDEVVKFVQDGKNIPDILFSIGKASEVGTEGATRLSDILHRLRGAGLDVAKSGQLMTELYTKFGSQAGESSKQILAFAQVAKKSGVNIDFVMKHLVAAGAPMAIFGMKADVAARTWTTFTDALKDTVPIEEIGRLVTTVTGNIAKMQFQTQAFVAQMSGMSQGVSALGGALRMEMDMRTPGGLEKNLQRITRTLARFGGGRITTLQEAVRDPSKEMQFQLQRQLVGQTLGVQGSADQSRVLEVLQKVQRGGISNLDAQKTMSELTKRGRNVQEASKTALERIVEQGSEQHAVLEAIRGVESAMATDIKRMATYLGRGRAKRPASQQETYAAGLHLKTALQRGGKKAQASLGRLGKQFSPQIAALAAGLADKPPPGVTTTKPVRVDPTTRMLAERREERVMPAAPEEHQRNLPMIEAVINRKPERREVPTQAYPYTPTGRRLDTPTGLVAPGVSAAGAAGGGASTGTTTPALGGEAVAGAETAGQSTNVTIEVMCAECHKEIVRKELAELSEQRDKHLIGIAT